MSNDDRRHIPGLWDRDAESLIAEVERLRATLGAIAAQAEAAALFEFGPSQELWRQVAALAAAVEGEPTS